MSNILKDISDLQFILGTFVAEPNDDLTRGAIRDTIQHYINSKLSVVDITSAKYIDNNIAKYKITDFADNLYELTISPGETFGDIILNIDKVI